MKTISMQELRHHAQRIITQVQNGERMILTRRGKPVARLEPIVPITLDVTDPFYALDELSLPRGDSLTSDQIDSVLYGQ